MRNLSTAQPSGRQLNSPSPLWIGLVFLLTATCTQDKPVTPPDHTAFDKLLKEHVSNRGNVNYAGFVKNRDALNQYLSQLSRHYPDAKHWTYDEQLAFWINAYNAYTIKLIIDHYPVTSIRDIGQGNTISFVNSPWDIRFITIGSSRMDLNNIEHGILRKQFHDPRIHMALVCASKSCPPLRNEAYVPGRLDDQLNDQARSFLNDHTRNDIAGNKAAISMIFKWYQGDFTKDGGSVRTFINQYVKPGISEQVSITYLPYDWSLNE